MRMSIIMVFAMVALAAVQMQSASAQPVSDISLTLTKQTPYPAEPGDVVNIEVTLQNNGTTTQALTLEVLPKGPFTLLPGETAAKSFTNLAASSSATKSYKFKVADNAVSSGYDLEFNYYSEGQTTGVLKKLRVLVQGTPKLVVDNITTNPEVIEPGDVADIVVHLRNGGTGSASQLELSLEAEPDTETGESKIVPVLSGGVTYIDRIGPGETKDARFRLSADNEAEYMTYMATLSIDYKEESGTSDSVTHNIGIPVKGSPIIDILSAKVDGSDFKVDIENIGTGTAKALKIEFIQDGEIKDSSVASELKPTRHKTLRFSGFRYGSAMINITYLDESNKFFANSNLVTVKAPSYADDNETPDLSGAVSVLFVLVLAEGYYIWRLRKRLKKR